MSRRTLFLLPTLLVLALSLLPTCDCGGGGEGEGEGEVTLPAAGITTATVVDGGVSGRQEREGAAVVTFTATPRGELGADATFTVEGGPTLVVQVEDRETASLTVDGQPLDGLGEATDAERAVIASLQSGRLGEAIAWTPLDVACLGELAPPVAQALLLPLQLVLKYGPPGRGALLSHLITGSACAWLTEDDPRPAPATVHIEHAAPFPTVMGYFPLDATGWSPDGDAQRTRVPTAVPDPHPVEAATGPCNSQCRGACGADCSPTNCSYGLEFFCGAGGSSGNEEQWKTWDCGVHPGCVSHDDCYDSCNGTFGCGTFNVFAINCRHNTADGCDITACRTFGFSECVRWANGLDPFTSREAFPYPTGLANPNPLCLAGNTGVHNVVQQKPYLTVGDALREAQDGDVIRVYPGTYDEGVFAITTSIRLESAEGPQTTTLAGLVTIQAPDVELEGFTITGAGVGVAVQGVATTSTQIVDNIIIDNALGIVIDDVTAGTPVVRGNLIKGATSTGLLVNSGTIVVEQNTFEDNAGGLGGAIFISRNAEVVGVEKRETITLTVNAGQPDETTVQRSVARHVPPFSHDLNSFSGNTHTSVTPCQQSGMDEHTFLPDCGFDIYVDVEIP
jgi:hypothetical protein